MRTMAKKDQTYPVVDAVRSIVIRIAESDRDALQCSPSRCVIAQAAMRALASRGIRDVRIGADSARLLMATKKHGTRWVRYNLTRETYGQVRAYDRERQPMPDGARVELEPPRRPLGSRTRQPTARPGGKRDGSRTVRSQAPSFRHIFVEPPDDRRDHG